NVLAVRRPLRRRFVTAQLGELARRLVASHRRQPQVMFCGPHRPLAIWRNLYVRAVFLLASHLTQQASFTGFNIGGPDLLLRLLQLAGGIGYMTFTADF